MVVQWLGLCAFITEGLGSVPGWGTKILQAIQCGQKNRGERTKKQDQRGRERQDHRGPGRPWKELGF